jgi:nicotinate-nucleotide adenylyltransferase
MSLLFLGGSFNPPHLGHLLVAERVREALAAPGLTLLVTGAPPHASGKTAIEPAHRLAMARLATASNPALGVDDRETRRPGKSYTIDILRELERENPGARPRMVVGADMLLDLPNWRDVDDVVSLCEFVPVMRPGFEPAALAALEPRFGAEFVTRLRAGIVAVPQVQVSSSEIRARIARGLSVRYLVPDPVLEYIARHGLYRA